MTRFLGIDLALNHGAGVLLDASHGPAFEAYYYHNVKKWTKGQTHIEIDKKLDKDIQSLLRLDQIEAWIRNTLEATNPDFVAIEGYAYSASNGAHQLGEAGGMLRRILWSEKIPFRIHDPKTIKMFMTNDGNAAKDRMIEAVSLKHGLSVDPDGVHAFTLEDIADATALSVMCETEFLLRTGKITLDSLDEAQIRAFNRVTEDGGQNLLARDWIR